MHKVGNVSTTVAPSSVYFETIETERVYVIHKTSKGNNLILRIVVLYFKTHIHKTIAENKHLTSQVLPHNSCNGATILYYNLCYGS